MEHKLRTLLVEPPVTGNIKAGIATPVEPLGLAYLAAVLEQDGYSVEILDILAQGCNLREKIRDDIYRVGLRESVIRDKLAQYKPDVVGISCKFTAHQWDSLKMARLVKEMCPEARVALGGAHASTYPESVLKAEDVDIVVIGEGEETFLEYVQRVEQERDIDDLKGIVYKRDGQFIRNPSRPLIMDLDHLPFPARHLLGDNRQPYPARYQDSAVNAMRKPVASISSSRGCMLNCVFCASHTIWGHTWRPRTPQNVVDEMEQLIRDYGIREFYFWDDNIAWKTARMIGLCDEILRRGLDIKWATPNGIAIYNLDREVLAAMKRSGYYRATFAIETGSEETMRFIGKPVNYDQAKKVINACHELGIWTHSSFIIGFPGEKLESIEATIKFAEESNLDSATFYIAQPFQGTRLFHIFEDAGLLDKGIQEGSGTVRTRYDTDRFTADELNALHQRAQKEFFKHRILKYLNPVTFRKQLWTKMNSLEKFGYLLRAGFRIMVNQVRLKRIT